MDQRLAKCDRASWISNRDLLLVFLILCATVFIAACTKPVVKPAEFMENDTCFHCKSPITPKELPFAAEFVTSNGFVRKFDDIGCMIANAKKVGKKNIVAFYAVDVQSRKIFPVEEVQFVHSDILATPRKGGTIAFKDPAAAEKYINQYKAVKIEKVKLDDLLR
jgi:hypothetical protein